MTPIPYSYTEQDWVIPVTLDKPGRTVTVQVIRHAGFPHKRDDRVSLGIAGIAGQSEWTWLSPHEAYEVSRALSKAGDIAL